MSTLEGKIALVTGASRGIGSAIARRLARDGALVAVRYGRSADAAQGVVRDIEAAGGAAFAVGGDLATLAGVHTLFETLDRRLTERTGQARFDILVNNAGVGGESPVGGTDEAAFDTLFAVNVKAAFFVTQEALPRLNDGGRIINLTSVVTRLAFPALAAYAMTKGALSVLTRSLAQQLGPRGITVNNIAPGVTETEMTTHILGDESGRQFAASLAALGRVGRPEDIADAAAFLASDDARWVTGTDLDASGGTHL